MANNFSAVAHYRSTWICDGCGNMENTTDTTAIDNHWYREIKLVVALPDEWQIVHDNVLMGGKVFCPDCKFNQQPTEYD